MTRIQRLHATAVLGSLFSILCPAAAQNWVAVPTSPQLSLGSCVASSANGCKLVAVDPNGGRIYTSANSGATWLSNDVPHLAYNSVASSADGTKLFATVYNGHVYRTTDAGVTWAPTTTPVSGWISVASSVDGTRLAAAIHEGGIWTSADSGVTWNLTDGPTGTWWSIVSSADGTKLAAAMFEGPIYTSSDSGTTWNLTSAPSTDWCALASSADGTTLAAGGSFYYGREGPIYVSTNSGVTWTQSSAPIRNWVSIASSVDGTRLTAAIFNQPPYDPTAPTIYMSTDSGATWVDAGAPGCLWSSVAASADGMRLAAVGRSGAACQVYTLQAPPALTITRSGGDILLSWLSSAWPYLLQQNPDLTTPSWADMTTTPAFTNGYFQMIVPPSAGNRFYRLRSL